jgi:hypothetical protein
LETIYANPKNVNPTEIRGFVAMAKGKKNGVQSDDLAHRLGYVLSILGVSLRDMKCYTVEGGLLR